MAGLDPKGHASFVASLLARRDETSIVAMIQMGWALPWTNVLISSAWSSLSSYPWVLRSLNSLAWAAARSARRTTVFQERRFALAMVEMLAPP